MKRTVFITLVAILTIFSANTTYAQCTLPTGEYTWGLSDLAEHIDFNFDRRSGVTEIVVPNGAVVSIKANDAWLLDQLGGLGDITFKVEEGGILKYNSKNLFRLSENSQLIIDGNISDNS